MLEGITVLNIVSINRLPVYFWIIILAIVIICLALTTSDLYLISFIFGMLLTILTCLITEPVPTGRYQYEVTIDKSVSVTELYEKYDIIEQRGDIWVLEDKEE